MLLQKDELKTIDYGHLTELLDTYIELKNEDKHLKHQILRRISRIRNPQSVKQLASYAQIAIEEKEDSFLSSISEALSNIGSKEAVGTLRRILISSPEGDAIGIISKSLSRVNNSDSIPLLKDIIIERLPGNESAIKAMMNMGGLGIYELSELIGSDKSGYTKAKFLKAIESKEFDKEAYAAFEKLAKESSEDQDIYKTAASKLKVTEN